MIVLYVFVCVSVIKQEDDEISMRLHCSQELNEK